MEIIRHFETSYGTQFEALFRVPDYAESIWGLSRSTGKYWFCEDRPAN